jgi:hypothetical protein
MKAYYNSHYACITGMLVLVSIRWLMVTWCLPGRVAPIWAGRAAPAHEINAGE